MFNLSSFFISILSNIAQIKKNYLNGYSAESLFDKPVFSNFLP